MDGCLSIAWSRMRFSSGVQTSANVMIGPGDRVYPGRFMIKLDTNTTSACKTRSKGIGRNGGVIAQSVSQDNSETQTSPVESSALLRRVSQPPAWCSLR